MFVEMAEIVNVVGLRGEVKLLVSGNFDESVLTSRFLRVRGANGQDEGMPIRCLGYRWKSAVVIARLEGIDVRESAEAMMGKSLGFRAADYDDPAFPRGERPAAFVYLDLRVVTTEGREVGRVDDVLTLPANWVLRVLAREGTEDETEILIPVIDDVIRELDRAGGRLVIAAMPGLLDDIETA